MSASEGAWRAEVNDAVAHRWPVVHGLIASVVLAFGLAVFLLVRRATGSLTAPLPPGLLLLTASAMLAWGWCMRIGWARCVDHGMAFSWPVDQFIGAWSPPLTLFLVSVACSYPPGGRAADWLVWLSAILAAVVGPKVAERWRRTHTEPVLPGRRRSPVTTPVEVREPFEEYGTLLQQLTRSRTADGRETISGTVVAEFVPGERTATLHIAFCPPFETLPQVDAEIADGPDASVEVTQVLHNGARFDVRLMKPAIEAAAISLEIVAHESAP